MSEITWYGHSAFKICCNDVTVVIDPFFAHDVEYIISDLGSVDLVLVTHDHADHVGETVAICRRTGAMLGAVVGTAGKLAANGIPEKQLLNGIGFNMGGTLFYKKVSITMTQAFHTSDSGTPVGYILKMPDGLVLYHAGDTCVFQDMALWGQLYKIDVALLPVGGVFTMDGEQAAIACSLLQCRNVIPMHWGTFPVLAQDTNAFCQALARRAPQCQCLNLSPGQSLQLVPEGQVC